MTEITRFVGHVSLKTILKDYSTVDKKGRKKNYSKEILFRVGSHVVARRRVRRQVNLNSRELRNRCFMADSLCCMYLIDRFSQLLRCDQRRIALCKYLRFQ